MSYPKFAIFRNADGLYFFRLYNHKGKNLVTGFPCEQRVQCITAIRELYAHAEKDHHYRMQIAHGQFYFQMTDERHTVICASPLYRTMAGMAYGIKSVKDSAIIAVIEDHTTVEVT